MNKEQESFEIHPQKLQLWLFMWPQDVCTYVHTYIHIHGEVDFYVRRILAFSGVHQQLVMDIV